MHDLCFLSRCKLNNNETNISDNKNNFDQDELKTSLKPADHFLLHIQDEPIIKKNSSSSPTSVTNYLDHQIIVKKLHHHPPPP